MGQVSSAPKTDMQNMEGNICMVTEQCLEHAKEYDKKNRDKWSTHQTKISIYLISRSSIDEEKPFVGKTWNVILMRRRGKMSGNQRKVCTNEWVVLWREENLNAYLIIHPALLWKYGHCAFVLVIGMSQMWCMCFVGVWVSPSTVELVVGYEHCVQDSNQLKIQWNLIAQVSGTLVPSRCSVNAVNGVTVTKRD